VSHTQVKYKHTDSCISNTAFQKGPPYKIKQFAQQRL